jgi:hypothetical protein
MKPFFIIAFFTTLSNFVAGITVKNYEGLPTQSGIIYSFTPNYIKKMKDPILEKIFKRLVESTQATIGDVVLRDTEM